MIPYRTGLKSDAPATFVQQGRLNSAQTLVLAELEGDSVPQGRLKIGRDVILDNLQPSLRDLIMLYAMYPGLASWAKFSLCHPAGLRM